MNRSETTRLLAVVSAFEGRQMTAMDVEAYSTLPVVQNNTYDVCSRAVLMFYDKNPEDNGFIQRFSPQALRYYIIKVKERDEIEYARARARMTPEQRRALEERETREIEAKIK